MARKTPCQTPGAVYHTRIHTVLKQVDVSVQLAPWVPFDLSEREAKLLEDNLHNAVELVLARYFPTAS